MASKVEICNLALNHIGQRPITSLDENSQAAKACSLIFDMTRDSVLRDNTWNFTTVIEQLALISDEKVPGWEYLYAYPPKCLFVRKIYDENSVNDPLPIEYQVLLSPGTKQKSIGTNTPLAYIEYTYQVTDPNLYDVAFIDSLSYALASKLAQNLAGNISLGKDLLAMYRSSLDSSKLSNAREGVDKRKSYSSFIISRG